MPRYKVKAFDGKTLTIEAPDESALDEAMAEYEGQAQAKPEAPKAPGWGETFVSQLPFGQTLQRVAKGEPAYAGSAEGVAAGAGDVGAAAGLAAGGAILGAPAVLGGTLLGAGIGTLGEKSGAYDKMRELEAGLRGEGIKSPETQSVPLNFLGMLGKYAVNPRQQAATVAGLLPAASTALASMGAAKGGQALIQKAAAGPKALPAGAGLLEQAGVKPTPAMVKFAETGERTGVPASIEAAQKANPFTATTFEQTQKAAADAAKAKVSSIPGAGMSPQATGGLLSDVMEAFQKRRGQAVGSAKDALRELDAGDVGKVASKRIIGQLEQGGVPFDETGFNTSLMKGTERMGGATAEALVQAERDLRGATLGQAINYLENFDEKFGAQLGAKYGDKAANAVKEARNTIKTTIIEAAREADPALAKALQDADRAYALSQPTVKPFLGVARGETSAADLAGKLFGKAGAKADKSMARLQKTMTPDEFGAVQDALAGEVLRQAGGIENLSLPKLKTALKSLGDNRKFLKSGVIKQLEDTALMMETAQVESLGMPNPSGTAAKLINATYGSPVGLVPAAISAPVIQGMMKAPGMIRTAQKAVQPAAQALAKYGTGKPLRVAAPTFYQALSAENGQR